MGKLKSNEFRQLIIKAISISFSIFFIIILFNTIFFNRTIAINYSIPVMIIGTCLVYLIIFSIYCIYKNKNFKFLEYNPKKVEILCILLIIFIIQYIFATLTYAYNGWDCGGVVSSAFAALQGENFNALYYSQYPNNIGILLLIKYVLVIARLFTDMTVVSSGFFSAIVFNIMMVDIAALFTFLTIKKVLGNKSSYLSLIFIVPLIIFSPYIIIPYTDTITMAFPIILLYLYIIIKE